MSCFNNIAKKTRPNTVRGKANPGCPKARETQQASETGTGIIST